MMKNLSRRCQEEEEDPDEVGDEERVEISGREGASELEKSAGRGQKKTRGPGLVETGRNGWVSGCYWFPLPSGKNRGNTEYSQVGELCIQYIINGMGMPCQLLSRPEPPPPEQAFSGVQNKAKKKEPGVARTLLYTYQNDLDEVRATRATSPLCSYGSSQGCLGSPLIPSPQTSYFFICSFILARVGEYEHLRVPVSLARRQLKAASSILTRKHLHRRCSNSYSNFNRTFTRPVSLQNFSRGF